MAGKQRLEGHVERARIAQFRGVRSYFLASVSIRDGYRARRVGTPPASPRSPFIEGEHEGSFHAACERRVPGIRSVRCLRHGLGANDCAVSAGASDAARRQGSRLPARYARKRTHYRQRTNQSIGSGQTNPNLSDQLSSSKGVICPPSGVDPEMRVPPPADGRTPVIPPPGTPGGRPDVTPK
jgi:hypothetical protein